jgi:hypothetical protein
MLWLLASESIDGIFDGSIDELAYRLRRGEEYIEKALAPLLERGFFSVVQDASTPLADGLRDAVPETETETETEQKPRGKRAPVEVVAVSVLVDAGFDEKTAEEFIATKADRKAPLTPRAWKDHLREAEKAGWTAQEAAEKVMAKTWKGFEAKYVEGERPLKQSSDFMAGAV